MVNRTFLAGGALVKRTLPFLLVLLLLLTGCTVGPDLLDNKSPADDFGALYDTAIPLPGDSGEPYLYALGEDLLFLSIHYTDPGVCDLILHRMSTDTGEITHSAAITAAGFGTVQVHGDTVCLSSAPSGMVWLLSAELEILAEYRFEPNYNSWYLSQDLRTLYQIGWDAGLLRYDLTSGTMTQLLPPESDVTYQDSSNDEVSFSYVDPESQMARQARLDLTTDQIQLFSQDGYFQPLLQQGNLWAAVPANREDVYILGRGDTLLSAFTRPNCYVSLTDRGELLCRDYLTGVISLYDFQGNFLSKLQLPMNQYGPSGYISDFMAWSEGRGGYFLLLTTIQDAEQPGMEPIQTTQLMFWDLNAVVAGEDLVLSDYDPTPQIPGGVSADPALYARAETIGKTYGVTIRIADQCETVYDSFETCTVSDSTFISLALDELEKALRRYPNGFFDQLRYGTIQTIEFSLVGDLAPLHPDEYSSISSAFAQPQTDKFIIVANLYLATEQNFHHELSHVIDKRLAWDADHSADALFSEESWMALNPDGFVYDESYTLHSSRWDVDYDCFVSSYSMTYPTEDRATIWEHAVMEHSWQFQASPLQKKLTYYCRCIRDCFDTTGWPEIAPWEAVLSE